MKNNKKGFTLIELLVVILIIGVLAGIAIPQYKTSARKAQFSQLQPIVSSILDAQNRYYVANNHTFATEIEALDVGLPGNYSRYYASNAGYQYTLSDGIICSVELNGQWITCALKDRMNLYLTVPQRTTVYTPYAGKRYCGACSFDTSDQYNKFCQKLTGKNVPDQTNYMMIGDYFCTAKFYQF